MKFEQFARGSHNLKNINTIAIIRENPGTLSDLLEEGRTGFKGKRVPCQP
jgi:hypothetical protein